MALMLSCLSLADELPVSSQVLCHPEWLHLPGVSTACPASSSVLPGPSYTAYTHARFFSTLCGEALTCFPETSARAGFSPPCTILPLVVVPVFPLGRLVSLLMLL